MRSRQALYFAVSPAIDRFRFCYRFGDDGDEVNRLYSPCFNWFGERHEQQQFTDEPEWFHSRIYECGDEVQIEIAADDEWQCEAIGQLWDELPEISKSTIALWAHVLGDAHRGVIRHE